MVQKVKGRYKIQVRVGGKRIAHYFTRKEDAEKKEYELKRQAELSRAGMRRPTDAILLRDYAALWHRGRIGKQAAGSTGSDESRLRNYWIPALGHRPLSAISSAEARETLDAIQAEHKLSNATRNRLRAVMHTLFQSAFMEERVNANPFARVELLKERPKRAPTLPAHLLHALMAAAVRTEPPGVVMALALMAYQGRRIGEALAAHADDFDLERGEMSVTRISDSSDGGAIREGLKSRPDGLVLPLFPLMRGLLERFKAKGDLCRGPDGARLTRHQIRDALARIRALTQIKATPHLLRATFATLAEEAGFTKEDIQAMLGHSTVLVTQRYTRRTAAPLVRKAADLGFMADTLATHWQQTKVTSIKGKKRK